VRVADNGDPDELLVGWNTYGPEGLVSSEYELWSLADGSFVRTWDEALAAMKVGTRAIITIPPELGYGARGAGNVIPPNAALIFDVELLEAK
jgi:hypothetical protein